MATIEPFSKYSSATQYAEAAPPWVPVTHQPRIRAYHLYEKIYWSHIDAAYKVMNRGLDNADEALYVPSSRIIIDTLHRYVGPAITFAVDPETGTTSTQLLAQQTFADLFKRERFGSRYSAAKKRNLLTQGDMLWHITADPLKPEGKRISILAVHPESYYPVTEAELVDGGSDTVVQVKLVELFQSGDDVLARVQLYDRFNTNGVIVSSVTVWKQEEWFDPAKSPQATIVPPTPLPAAITAFPVYHIPNGDDPGEAFGSSELRGLEVLQAALNQSATDEDISLAMMGLGVFATDQAGSPKNVAGESTAWFIAPGAVIENAKGLRRLDGITTVQPYTDHFNRLEGWLADASGATDAARGRLEVSEAESGIALQLKLGPTLAKAADQESVITDVATQMFFDLTQAWFPTFEPVNFTDVTVGVQYGDKLPVNRTEEATLTSNLVLAGILSTGSARKYLESKGFAGMFDPSEAELILAEKVALAAAEGGDPAQDRATNEVNGGSGLGSVPEGDA